MRNQIIRPHASCARITGTRMIAGNTISATIRAMTPADSAHDELLTWQREVWDTMASTYLAEAEHRLLPCSEGCLDRLRLQQGDRVLDLGSGTGALSLRASRIVGPDGRVTAVDISDEMLTTIRQRAAASSLINIDVLNGRAEKIPVRDGLQTALAASLSLMFVIDKAAAAREMARVLAPGGRLAVAVWAPPDRCDIVRFQRTVGLIAPEPPVKGVGPGSMANPKPFMELLASEGIDAHVEEGECNWAHPNLQHAWDTFASVTAGRMSPEQVAQAKETLARDMWQKPDAPREFKNTVLYLVGTKG